MSKRLLALLLIVCFVVAIPCQASAVSNTTQSKESISTSEKTQLPEDGKEEPSIGGELLKKKLEQQQEAVAVSKEDTGKQDEIFALDSSVKEEMLKDADFNDVYAGEYINGDGDLVICVTSKDVIKEIKECVKDEITVEGCVYIDADNVKYKVVKYSKATLEKTHEDFDEINASLKEDELTKEQSDLLSRLASYGEDYERNCIRIGIENYTEDDAKVFESIYGEYPYLDFYKGTKITLQSTYKPGRELFIPGIGSVSLGYKAYKKDPRGNKVYGFTTCAHGIVNRTSNYVYASSNTTSDNIIGIIYENGFNDNPSDNMMDYSFIVPLSKHEISDTTEYRSAKISGIASPKAGALVYKEGISSKLSSSYITKWNDRFNVTANMSDIPGHEGVFAKHIVYTSSCFSKQGDSGGIVYDENCSVVGLITGGEQPNEEAWTVGESYITRADYIQSEHKIYPHSGAGTNTKSPSSGKCGADVAWEYVASNKTLTIMGGGDMYNYFRAPWADYYDKIEKVVIADGVTSIGEYAFYNCINLKEVKIGNTVKSIGFNAFAWCKALGSIEFPNSLNKIGFHAFFRCTNLKSIRFNGKQPALDDTAFAGLTLTAYYPSNYTYYSKNCGGKITWSSIKVTPITNATIEFNAEYLYTGSEIEPTPKVKILGKTLVKDKDYYFEYSNNIEVGETAMVIVKGKGDYIGSTFKYFRILPKPITSATIAIVADQTYTGSVIKPTPTVKMGSKTLVKDKDYCLDYSNNTNVGTATITVKGKGSYNDTSSKTFKIVQRSVSSASIASISAYTYSGSAYQPTPKVTVNGRTLVKDTDYTLSYKNNTNAGTATVTVTGKGNYKSTASKTFTINSKSLSSATISSVSDKTYTGSEIKPTPTVKVDGKTLQKDTDYTLSYSNNKKVGTATITVTGKGSYKGTANKTFKIVQRSVSGATIASISAYTYTGSAHKPTPKVTVNGITLVKDTDYTLSYKNNTNAGTATVTVTGKGNYKSTASKTFTINAKSLSNVTISSVSDQTYTGSAIKPTPTVKLDGKKLVSGTDYYFEYSNNTLVGDAARITVKGKGNYTSSKTIYFKIKQRDINGLIVYTGDAQYTYTGSEIKPTVSVKFNATTLTKGTHYTVTYSNNKNVGTATITLKGKGNYKGTVTRTFKIVPKAPTGLTVSYYSTTVNKIKWNSVSGATGYEVWRKTGSGSYKCIYSGTSTQIYDSGVYPGSTFTYYVKAYKKVNGTTYTSNASGTKVSKR